MTQSTIKAEDLYLHYRRNRTTALPNYDKTLQSHDEYLRDEHLQDETRPDVASMAEQVYQRYQHHRTDDREVRIDAILASIKHAEPAGDQHVTAAGDASRVPPSAAETANSDPLPVSRSNPARARLAVAPVSLWKGILAWLSENPLGRVAVPAIAAGVLGLIMLPLVFNADDAPSSVPLGLLAEAPSVVQYVDNKDALALGFSSAVAPEKSAFNRGLLAVDFTIAAHSDDEPLLLQTGQRVLNLAVAEKQTELEKLIRSALRLPNSLNEHQDSIIEMLASPPEKSATLDWFRLGRATQVLSLSALLQQSASTPTALYSGPLLESMALFEGIDTPSAKLPASKLLVELRSLVARDQPNDAPKDGAVRQFIEITRDIKILMR